jgi:hypothetical protein
MTIFNDFDFTSKLFVLATSLGVILAIVLICVLAYRGRIAYLAAHTPPIDFSPFATLVEFDPDNPPENLIDQAELMADFIRLQDLREEQAQALIDQAETIRELEARLEREHRLKQRYWRRIKRMKLGVQA